MSEFSRSLPTPFHVIYRCNTQDGAFKLSGPRESAQTALCQRGPMTGATSLAGVPGVIIYTVKQSESGLWSVSYMGIVLEDGLHLGPAIKRARDAARAEHLDSGLTTRVEMHGAGATVPLANYQKMQSNWTGATA